MNQKLADWASIAEIFSGIAVVVTLVFLIVGIRDNTNVVRNSAFSDHLAAFNDYSMTIAANAELRAVYMPFVTGNAADLDADEKDLLQLLLFTSFRKYERAYFSEQYGLLGRAEWTRLERSLCRSLNRAQAADRTTIDLMDELLSEEFMDHLRRTCN